MGRPLCYTDSVRPSFILAEHGRTTSRTPSLLIPDKKDCRTKKYEKNICTCFTDMIYFARWTMELGSKHGDRPIGIHFRTNYGTSLLGTSVIGTK